MSYGRDDDGDMNVGMGTEYGSPIDVDTEEPKPREDSTEQESLMADRVWMVHPYLPGARISCAPSGVGARQQSGWTVDETQDTAGTSDAAVEATEEPKPREDSTEQESAQGLLFFGSPGDSLSTVNLTRQDLDNIAVALRLSIASHLNTAAEVTMENKRMQMLTLTRTAVETSKTLDKIGDIIHGGRTVAVTPF